MVDDRAQQVALFRYSLVRELASERLSNRERGALARSMAAREQIGPDGLWVRVSRTSLDRWTRAYRLGGFEALVPRAAAGRDQDAGARVGDGVRAATRAVRSHGGADLPESRQGSRPGLAVHSRGCSALAPVLPCDDGLRRNSRATVKQLPYAMPSTDGVLDRSDMPAEAADVDRALQLLRHTDENAYFSLYKIKQVEVAGLWFRAALACFALLSMLLVAYTVFGTWF